MGYYPVFLDLNGKPCIVIGGGPIAQRKVEGVLAAGAQVTVVSPYLTPLLAALRDEGRLLHIPREYVSGDLAGYALAFVATDDGAINAQVAAEGRQSGVLINAADDPDHCDFIMPAVVRRGELTIAISTAGGSPALARRVREELEDYFTEEYVSLLEMVVEVRQELRRQDRAVTPEAWNIALTPDLRRLLAQGKRQEAKERLLADLLTGAAER